MQSAARHPANPSLVRWNLSSATLLDHDHEIISWINERGMAILPRTLIQEGHLSVTDTKNTGKQLQRS